MKGGVRVGNLPEGGHQYRDLGDNDERPHGEDFDVERQDGGLGQGQVDTPHDLRGEEVLEFISKSVKVSRNSGVLAYLREKLGWWENQEPVFDIVKMVAHPPNYDGCMVMNTRSVTRMII